MTAYAATLAAHASDRPACRSTPQQRAEIEASVPVEARVLDRAAEMLIQYGWCQHVSSDSTGRHCLVHVIARAAGEMTRPATPAAYQACASASEYVHDVLEDRYPDFDGHIDHWNDRPTTSLDDVLDVLAGARAAISGCSAAVIL